MKIEFEKENVDFKNLAYKQWQEKQSKNKIKKIRSLFILENFSLFSFEKILKFWEKIEGLYYSAIQEKSFEKSISSLAEILDLGSFNKLIQCFSNYNQIQSKFKQHTLLLIWASVLFPVFLLDNKDHFDDGEFFSYFKNILRHFLKQTFYIVIILIKAIKNQVISIKEDCLEKYLQSL